MPKKILLIMGTRPEIIKMLPLYFELKARESVETKILFSGQHSSLATNIFKFFEVQPDFELNTMAPGQSLAELSSKILTGCDEVIRNFSPDIAFVHGDTTTSSMGALACFYNKVKVCHVEAGLRSGNNLSPWPEEINRRINAQLSELHFAPTESAKQNLTKEGALEDSIFVVGNTVVDGIRSISQTIATNPSLVSEIEEKYSFLNCGRNFVMVTLHRRENFGQGFRDFVRAITILSQQYPELNFVWPVHPNPEVRDNIVPLVGHLSNILITEPIEYFDFIYCMNKMLLILTDSGGIQEEVCSIGKSAIVLRTVTERMEAVQSGHCVLAGTDPEKVVKAFNQLIYSESPKYLVNPFGDGTTAKKIVDKLDKFFT